MKLKNLKVAFVLLLTLSLVLGPISNIILATDNNSNKLNVESLLKNLTDEQRAKFNDLYPEESTKLRISPEVNLNSEDDIEIIVQFNVDPAEIQVIKGKAKGKAIGLNEAKEKVEKSHKDFKNKIEKSKSNKKMKIKKEYRNAFNGVSMTTPANKVIELINISEVKAVWVDEKQQFIPPVDEDVNVSPNMIDSLPFIGVDRLHNEGEGINGEGVKVGVLDTGIDYNHPDLKDAYVGGYDFVDNDNDPMEATYEDWKQSGWPETYYGSTYYTSHGTHVSGTIAGQGKNDSEYSVTGVSPGADLHVYRVLGPYGMGYTSWIMAGIDKAVEDGMDVINLSLGAGINDPLYPTSVAINNAMISGTVAVVSAGNAGSNSYTLGSPGSSALAITVGASDVSMEIPTIKGSYGEDGYDLRLMAKNFSDKLEELKGQSLELVEAGLGYPSDFEGKDYTNKIALIQRGQMAFVEKIANAKAAGAKAVIIWNNVDGVIPYYFGEGIDFVPTFTMTKDMGQMLKDSLSEQKQFTFNEIGSISTDGDKLADFSSRGPSLKTFDIKPDVTAPGVMVYSTAPSYINDKENPGNYGIAYQRMSGTSMSAPHVAGVAALVLQNNPDYSVFDVKTSLMNTSVDLSEDYSVFQVGAGRIDAYNAVHSDMKIQVIDKDLSMDGYNWDANQINIDDITGAISFGYHYENKDSSITDSRKVEITNNSNDSKGFEVSVEYLSSQISGANDSAVNEVAVTVIDELNIESNSTVEFTPAIEVPLGAESGTYEGYIHLVNKADETEHYQIPFAIMVAKRGINHTVDRKAFASDASNFHPHMSMPATFLVVGLRSPMETMDLVVKDGNTGEYLGYLGSFNTEFFNSAIGMDFLVPFVFTSGVYYPFTEDGQISEEWVNAPDGAYELEIIGRDEYGDVYKPTDYVFIDNKAPEVNMDQEPGVYEIEYNNDDKQGITWFTGKVYDSNIDLMKEKGIEEARNNYDGQFVTVDQGLNTVVGYDSKGWGWPTHYFIPEADGSFKFGVTPEEVENGAVVDFKMYAFDAATAGDFDNGWLPYYFIEKGNKYATAKLDKNKIYLDEEVTVSITMNNAEDLIGGEFTLNYWKEHYEFVDAKVTPEFMKFAQDNNLNTKVEVGEIVENHWANDIPVSAYLEGDVKDGIDGEMPILDVTFKLINDEYYNGATYIRFNEAKHHKLGEDEANVVPSFITETLEIVPKSSIIWGHLGPEAYFYPGQNWVWIDLKDKGVEITAIAPDGTEYKGAILEWSKSQFEIHGIPASEETYEVVVKVPGHFESRVTVNVGEEINGELLGVNARIYPGLQLAGDVNGDQVIDVEDAFFMANHINKPGDRTIKADINQDGNIDATDMSYIVKNYLSVNEKVENAPAAKEKRGGSTLANILEELGLSDLLN